MTCPSPSRSRAGSSTWSLGLSALLGASLSGCSLFSPLPLWELAKATGSMASNAIAMNAPQTATATVFHAAAGNGPICIEYNRDSAASDVVPALQAELHARAVRSRVYEAGSQAADCDVWLRYTASIEWGLPPLSGQYRPYLDKASFALHQRDGRLLATSSYELDGVMGMGRWADTRAKLSPVVTALLGLPPATLTAQSGPSPI